MRLARRSGAPLQRWLGDMTAAEAVEMTASARLDPDEEERADIRWAFGMEARHAFAGAQRPLRAEYWLSLLPWRPEFLSLDERQALRDKHDAVMAKFESARRARKAAAHV